MSHQPCLAEVQLYSSCTNRNESCREKSTAEDGNVKVFLSGSRGERMNAGYLVNADSLLLFVLQEVGLVDYHSHHARDYSSHLAQPHRRRPSLLSEFQPGNER